MISYVKLRWRTALLVVQEAGAVGGEVGDAFVGLRAAAAAAGATAPRGTCAVFTIQRQGASRIRVRLRVQGQ